MSSPIPLPPSALTPWHMIESADIVVQSVMAILLAASVATWTIILVKSIEIARARRRLARSLRAIRSAKPEAPPAASLTLVARHFVHCADEEIRQSATLPPEGVKDRIVLRLRRIENAVIRRMGRGTGILASIGSCGPFVGLFGTVWGIMDSFISISRTQTTNLAVVAPGIAEALLATAFGLGAAIPAVLAYNAFARLLASYRAELADLSAMVLAHAAREIDQSYYAGGRVAAPGPVPLRPAAE